MTLRSTPITTKIARLLVELEHEHSETLEQRHGWLAAKPLDAVIGRVEAALELAQAEQL